MVDSDVRSDIKNVVQGETGENQDGPIPSPDSFSVSMPLHDETPTITGVNNKRKRNTYRGKKVVMFGVRLYGKESGDPRKKRFARLSEEEHRELVANLEHIVAVGNKIWMSERRFEAWMNRDKIRQLTLKGRNAISFPVAGNDGSMLASNFGNLDVSIVGDAPVSDAALPRTEQDVSSQEPSIVGRLVHAEDNRMYYHRLPGLSRRDVFAAHSWPVAYNVKNSKADMINLTPDDAVAKNVMDDTDDDIAWDEEYGNSINETEFAERYLLPQTDTKGKEKKRPFKEKTMRRGKTDQAFQLLIRNSWERAVGIVSSSVAYDRDTTIHVPASTLDSCERQPASDANEAAEKCMRMKISCKPVKKRYDNGTVSFQCPSCLENVFSSSSAFKQHFYGDSAGKGCCWKLIDRKQKRMVQRVIERESMFVIDGLLEILFTASRERVDEIGIKEARLSPLNWMDLIRIFRDAVTKNSTPQNEHGGVDSGFDSTADTNLGVGDFLETMRVHSDIPPIPLNENVLKSISMRLAERYALMTR